MARHKAISKARWLTSQKRFSEVWKTEDLPAREQARIVRDYLPLLLKHHATIDEQSRILDMCCGPVCAASMIAGGKKSYLDPMLDTYRRMYPGKLPKGRHMALATEKVPEDSHSFDIILCINGLDKVQNPELTLNEIERLLAPGGTLLIGLPVFPGVVARMRYLFERFFTPLRDESHPYSYSLEALHRTIARHFDVVECIRLDSICSAETRAMAVEYAFICRSKDHKDAGAD